MFDEIQLLYLVHVKDEDYRYYDSLESAAKDLRKHNDSNYIECVMLNLAEACDLKCIMTGGQVDLENYDDGLDIEIQHLQQIPCNEEEYTYGIYMDNEIRAAREEF